MTTSTTNTSSTTTTTRTTTTSSSTSTSTASTRTTTFTTTTTTTTTTTSSSTTTTTRTTTTSTTSTTITTSTKTITVCEHDLLTLTCGVGRVLNIISAWYGRKDVSTCNQNGCGNCNTSCYLDIKINLAEYFNRYKNSNTVTVENSIAGDPCYGTGKYLILIYECV